MPEKKKTKAKAEERITEEIKETPKQPPYKVLFLASECVPFVKTGGLADVIGALPKELKRQGVDVRVMIPLITSTTLAGATYTASATATRGSASPFSPKPRWRPCRI